MPAGRPRGVVPEEYEFFKSQGYAFGDIATMLGIQEESLARTLRRNGTSLVARNGSYYETGKPDRWGVTYRTPADLLAAFLKLDPPQGFRAASVALQLGIATATHFLTTLRRAGVILVPLGGRGLNAGPRVGCYRWEIRSR